MSNFLEVVIVIACAGAAGGLVNYLLVGDGSSSRTVRSGARFMVVGIIVSFTVPLFLSVAQSALIKSLLSANSESSTRATDLLTLIGVCIVASFASRAFLDDLSKRLLTRVNEVEQVAKEAVNGVQRVSSEAAVAEELFEEKLDRVVEAVASGSAETIISESDDVTSQRDAPVVSPIEDRVLRATTEYTLRTLSGIAKDVGVSKDRIGEIVDELARKGLMAKTKSKNTGGDRWRITALGLSAIRRTDPGFRPNLNAH
jgi:DNA-binding MarR family transcriptional regulator